MKRSKPLTQKRIDWLRKRLQRCEKNIIDTVQWDKNYYYEGYTLSYGQCNQLKDLFLNRMCILNELFDYTDNEVKRLEELNNSLNNATQQLYKDFQGLYKARLVMTDMERYDNNTWFESLLSFNYNGDNSVIKMPEDEYYGSQFDKMLELLCSEEDELSYRGCVWACKALNSSDRTANLDEDSDFCDVMNDGRSWADWMSHPKIEHINICHAVHDLFDHHLYSIPDMLRMNCFKVKMVMEQERNVDTKFGR